MDWHQLPKDEPKDGQRCIIWYARKAKPAFARWDASLGAFYLTEMPTMIWPRDIEFWMPQPSPPVVYEVGKVPTEHYVQSTTVLLE